jgi:ATP adenylyltransferase
MKRLYAPWRHDYVNRMTGKSDKKNKTSKDCVFCKQFAADEDDAFFIVKRFKHCAVMMNRYPYNSGHVMILPYDHKGELDDLSSKVRSEMIDAVSASVRIIGKALGSEGFNVGINIGSAGGGGIPSHLHIHVLPRWRGDTNFLEVIGETKLISGDLENTFKKLKKAFANVSL